MVKGLKLKVREFWEIIHMFVEVTGEKLVEGLFASPILNKTFPLLIKDCILLLMDP